MQPLTYLQNSASVLSPSGSMGTPTSVAVDWALVLRMVELSTPDLSPDVRLGGASSQVGQPVLAQQFDQDILGDLANAWNNFVQSGQIWALIIGIIIGYLIRGLTTYR
jgi:hypothetical protein